MLKIPSKTNGNANVFGFNASIIGKCIVKTAIRICDVEGEEDQNAKNKTNSSVRMRIAAVMRENFGEFSYPMNKLKIVRRKSEYVLLFFFSCPRKYSSKASSLSPIYSLTVIFHLAAKCVVDRLGVSRTNGN